MTTTTRRCTYCGKPAEGRTVAVDPTDPDTARADLAHRACYAAHMQSLGKLHRALAAAARS